MCVSVKRAVADKEVDLYRVTALGGPKRYNVAEVGGCKPTSESANERVILRVGHQTSQSA